MVSAVNWQAPELRFDSTWNQVIFFGKINIFNTKLLVLLNLIKFSSIRIFSNPPTNFFRPLRPWKQAIIEAEETYLASQGTLMQLSVPNPDAAAALIIEKWLYSAAIFVKKKWDLAPADERYSSTYVVRREHHQRAR